MYKLHSKPEFQVIRQEAANAKFFVASGDFSGNPPSTGGTPPANSASHYGEDSDGLSF